jgi:hypothetical protein
MHVIEPPLAGAGSLAEKGGRGENAEAASQLLVAVLGPRCG